MQPTALSTEADLVLLSPNSTCTPVRVIALDAQGQPAESPQHAGPALLRWRGPDVAFARYYPQAPDRVIAPQSDALCLLDITLVAAPGTAMPPWIDVFVDPAALDGMPDACLSTLRYVKPGVERSYYWRQPVQDGQAKIWVGRGAHLIGGGYAPDGDQGEAVLAIAVQDGAGNQLQGNPYLGYSIVVSGTTKLTLTYKVQ